MSMTHFANPSMVASLIDGPPFWDGSLPVTFAETIAVTLGAFTNYADQVDLARGTKDRGIVSNNSYDAVSNNEGAAHIYTYAAGVWTLEQTILPPSSPDANAFFGTNVAMDASGTRCVITQDSAGVTAQANVFVYERTGVTWSLLDTITTTYIAGTVSSGCVMSGDGNVVVVHNNSGAGEIEIWRWGGASFALDTSFAVGNNNFGIGLNISDDGKYIIVPEFSRSRLYVYEDPTGLGSWSLKELVTGVVNNLPRNKAATITNDGQGLAMANSNVINTWNWNGASYDKIDTNLPAGFIVGGGGMSSNGLVTIALSVSDASIAVYEGNTFNGYTLSSTQVPTDAQNVASMSVASNDGRMLFAGNDGWKVSNNQQGRAISFVV